MAGGGDVRIIGGNKRVKDGVAAVSDNCLHVKVCDAEITSSQTPSESSGGRPIQVDFSDGDVLIHTVPATARLDLITLFVCNEEDKDFIIRVRWGSGGGANQLRFLAPSNETVPTVVRLPLGPGETVQVNNTLNATAGQTILVVADIERIHP